MKHVSHLENQFLIMNTEKGFLGTNQNSCITWLKHFGFSVECSSLCLLFSSFMFGGIGNIKTRLSLKINNPVDASTIGADANLTHEASLKNNEKTAHVETMLPHLDPQCRKEELTAALVVC